jgi:sugar phosphate isomerase/epimerase
MIELGYASAEPPFNVADVKNRLADTGLAAGVCSFLSAEHDIANPEPSVRKRGVAYIQALIATVAKLGGQILSSPALCGALPSPLPPGRRASPRVGMVGWFVA